MKLDRRQCLVVAVALGAAFSGAAIAQAYPDKPISIVVGYPPGGDTDAMARLFADKLSQRLKQTVIVENKPGAGGTVGNSFVGKAKADGYTLLFTPNPFTTAPFVMKLSAGNQYDVLNGFEPIIKMATQPLVLVAHPSAGVKSVTEMVAAADKALVSRTLQLLAKRGLVKVLTPPVGRKGMVVSMTDEGQLLYEKVMPMAQRSQAAMILTLSAHERRTLYEVLRRLRAQCAEVQGREQDTDL